MNDFSKATLNKLARKGITLVGLTAIPVAGNFLNTERGYCLNNNGQHQVRTFIEVMKMV